MNQSNFKKIGRFSLISMLAIWPLSSVFAQAHSSSEHHAHQQLATQQLELDHGRLWRTDASLREGMERVRAAAADSARQAGSGEQMTARQSRALAASIQDSVAFMVTHCHLQPEADANLHILLGRLLAADGLPQVLDVLDLYPRYFAHPGWRPITRNRVPER
ncbi:MAG: hypothetical protein KGJ96_07295 [Xanthomonadaceae bacterium]|nr:hypothetical protein [Xanthomonadaceae bacterium]